MGWLWLAAVGVASAPFAQALDDVVVNEAQVSNEGAVLDEDGDGSDWIELFNRGSNAVDLAGWWLSDRPDSPAKWCFPPRALPAGGRLVVFASGKDRTHVVSTAPIASPQEVPGLVLWLRAEGEAYTNGARVGAWSDLSGLGNHATQTVAAAQPAFVTNAVNGRPALRFTKASSQQLLLPVAAFNGMSGLRDWSAFIVCRWGGQATSGLLGAWGSSANTHFEIGSGGQIRLRVAALDSVRSNAVMTAGAWCQVAGFMNGAGDLPAASVYRDGVFRGSMQRDPGAAALSGYTTFGIGNSDSNTRFFDGYMAEVIFFNRALPTAERQAVERYLAERYSLPLSNGVANAELHANFSLDADGETVVLTRPDASAADAVAVPGAPTGASYGRSPDGAEALAFFASPTPGAANAAAGYGPPLKKPAFSRARGACDAPFELSLSHEDPAAAITYTLDGSEPSHTNGLLYAAPFAVSNTTVVRASAYRAGALPQRAIATHSYLFLDRVASQTGTPPGYPTAWGSFTNVSYGLSAAVAAQPGFTNALLGALRAVPILSLSLSRADLFGTNGVYANPLVEGFERAASAEWLTNGAGYVQVEAGLRVQGGASRDFNNTPKKSLRLLFKEAYGDARLKKPVLADGGTALADFNTLILRADYNNSWLHWDAAQRLRGVSVHDQWVRDTQIAMSGCGSHGSHVQLFVNGLYWGLYNVSERPDAAFAASVFGGEPEEYDAMTHDGIRDGDNVAWNALVAAARSNLAERVHYEAVQQYLDVPFFADYMLVNLYGGNEDWPHNNWNAVRRRAPGAGYRFFCWDAERTLEVTNVNKTAVTGSLTNSPNPASFYAALRTNAEFRLTFADRAHRHLFNGGALTPASAAARFAARTATVETALFGESARWGAYRCEIYDRNGPSPRYGLSHYSNECTRLLGAYFPVRTALFLAQLRAAGLYPAVAAPELSQHGGAVSAGEALAFTNAPGAVYVTFDGVDPRVPYTGEPASNAWLCAGPFALSNACVVKARARTNGVWSALTEATFGVLEPDPAFLPAGDGDWGVATNWSGGVVPQGAGRRARIGAAAADRDVNLRAPATVGALAFELGGSAYRSRVRDRSSGNALTFDGGGAEARVSVTGDGAGHAEFEVEAGVVLQSDVVLDVRHSGGDPEHGALRLRERWSGPGGLRKTGAGVASLTGENKVFAGRATVEAGVLKVTGSAAPSQAADVTVLSGGQLRLTSGSAAGGASVVYAFGGPLTLSGAGRGPEVPDGAGQGKLGALRYDPGTASNACVLSAPVALLGEAAVHVEGSQNRLALAGGVTGGARLVKTGGGALALPAGLSLTAAVEVANGTVAFDGAAETGPLAGPGAVRLDGQVVRAPSASGLCVEAVLRHAAGGAASNGCLRLGAAPQSLVRLRVYLPAVGAAFRGALFAPLEADLSGALRGAVREVYAPDAAGVHEFGGMRWSLRPEAQVVARPDETDFGAGLQRGRVVEVRLAGEPASYGAWREQAFTNEADRLNEAVSGPLADPRGSGVPNLTRYALGLGWEAPPASRLPRLTLDAAGADYAFPFEAWRDDVAFVAETSERLDDWSGASLLFDSRSNFPETFEGGWLTLRDSGRAPMRFYRLRLLWLGGE